jgi:hypothetical protein
MSDDRSTDTRSTPSQEAEAFVEKGGLPTVTVNIPMPRVKPPRKPVSAMPSAEPSSPRPQGAAPQRGSDTAGSTGRSGSNE